MKESDREDKIENQFIFLRIHQSTRARQSYRQNGKIRLACETNIEMVQNKKQWKVLEGFRVTPLLGHGPQLLRGLCPVHVLGSGGRTCCLEHT